MKTIWPVLIGLAAVNYVFSHVPSKDNAMVSAILFVGLCVLIVGIKNK